MQQSASNYSLFISFPTADQGIAGQVCEALEQRGFTCWISFRDIATGADYGGEIVQRIQGTDGVVLVISRAANESKYVFREAELAIKFGKDIFPVRSEPVNPGPQLEFFISSNQWIDLWSGDFAGQMDRLARDVRKRLERRSAALVESEEAGAALDAPGPTGGGVLTTSARGTGSARSDVSRRRLLQIAAVLLVLLAGAFIGVLTLGGGPEATPPGHGQQRVVPIAAATETATPTAEAPAAEALDGLARSGTAAGLAIQILHPASWLVISAPSDEHLAIRDGRSGTVFLAGIGSKPGSDWSAAAFVDDWKSATARPYGDVLRVTSSAARGPDHPFMLEVETDHGFAEAGTMVVTPFEQPDGSRTLFRWWASIGHGPSTIPTIRAIAASFRVLDAEAVAADRR